MEIVCRSEAYRRFESSSLRQKKGTVMHRSFFCLSTDLEEDSRVGANPRERIALLPKSSSSKL